jgi:outer membrane immunogenic protein
MLACTCTQKYFCVHVRFHPANAVCCAEGIRSFTKEYVVGKTLLFVLASLAFTGSAQAAENEWTGFYMGLSAGQNGGDAQSSAALSGLWAGDLAAPSVSDGLSTNNSFSGTSVGIQFGYDHQFSNHWLVGIEADYQKLNADDSTTEIIPAIDIGAATQRANLQATTRTEIDKAYSIRSKLGYTTENVLWYATAGYARSSVDASSAYIFDIPAFISSFSKAGGSSGNASGLIWGAGVDWRFADHWSAGLRYTRSKRESFSYVPATTARAGFYLLAPTDTAVEQVRQDVEYDNVSLSINYRF